MKTIKEILDQFRIDANRTQSKEALDRVTKDIERLVLEARLDEITNTCYNGFFDSSCIACQKREQKIQLRAEELNKQIGEL